MEGRRVGGCVCFGLDLGGEKKEKTWGKEVREAHLSQHIFKCSGEMRPLRLIWRRGGIEIQQNGEILNGGEGRNGCMKPE